MDISIIRDPYNKAWEILKIIRDDDTEEAWIKFGDALRDFYALTKNTELPHESDYLCFLYRTILEAAEIIAIINRQKDLNK